MFRRASAIAAAGMVLSHPTRTTTASNRFPRETSSIESAITSRLTSDARMPADPIVIPSEMETVLNSIGVPPAARMPFFTSSASSRRWKLHGPISIHVFATPMSGRRRSSGENPDARSIARAGARLGPSGIAPLYHFSRSATRVLSFRPARRRRLAFGLAPARIRSERAQRSPELRQVQDSARAGEIVARGGDVGVEAVLPGAPRHGPRFELGEIDPAQREDAQGLEQRAGLAAEREDHARLVGRAERHAGAADREEPGDVVVEVLDARAQRLEAEQRARARRRNRGGVAARLVAHHL